MHDLLAAKLSPEPLLAVAERYRGTMIDAEQGIVVGPDRFRQGKQELGRAFASHGLSDCDRVLLAVSNGPTFVAALVAILECGGSPLMVHAKTPAGELGRTAERFGARFIVGDECKPATLEGIADKIQSVEVDWGALTWATVAGTSVAQDHGPTLAGVPLHPTSGTTGVPKVALRPGAAAVAEAEHYIETIGIDRDDVILAATPQSHAYAYGMGVMTPLASGASVVTLRMFNPATVRRAFAEHGVTIFPAVPAMLDMLMMESAADLGITARAVFSAGAPMMGQTAAEFRRRTGISVRPLYGTTETGGISVGGDRHGDTSGCVGPAMKGVDVDVRPAEDGADGDVLGRFFVRSSSMMAGYLDDAGLDTSPLVNDWLDTGDLAYVDKDGAIHLRGRQTDLINVYGMKVVPSEVEAVVAAIAGVAEAKVYGGSHPSGSQVVKAAIVADGSVELASIVRRCEEELLYYKRPTIITMVNALPKTPSGKIIRELLP
jgi:acyl-coenzyme A synthetase/AMP-(fatty) acid ligase